MNQIYLRKASLLGVSLHRTKHHTMLDLDLNHSIWHNVHSEVLAAKKKKEDRIFRLIVA